MTESDANRTLDSSGRACRILRDSTVFESRKYFKDLGTIEDYVDPDEAGSDVLSIMVVDEVHVVKRGRLRFGCTDFTSASLGCGVGAFRVFTIAALALDFRVAMKDLISASVFAKAFASISFWRSTPASSGFSRNGPYILLFPT
jgi:hypothetical protein